MLTPRERFNEVLKRLGSNFKAEPYSLMDESWVALAEALERKFKELEKELRDASR